ncbi:MAG: hypothetical protein HN416_13855 [Nitrospina sp.]|jgi:hypothetical protein|nr:hypothetical protein [Nitrospina sp.]
MDLVFRINQFKRELEQADKNRIKAARLAVRVEAARLRKVLGDEIESGAPGGRSLSPLSEIAKARRYRRKNKNPLYMFKKLARYRAHETSDGGYQVDIGFSGLGKDDPATSGRWQKLIYMHQAGARIPVTHDLRKGLIAIAKGMRGKKKNVFFLKKSTTAIDVPARPIIESFWNTHEREAEQNIIVNFARKMRGERI